MKRKKDSARRRTSSAAEAVLVGLKKISATERCAPVAWANPDFPVRLAEG
jgi:hypothetical protein